MRNVECMENFKFMDLVNSLFKQFNFLGTSLKILFGGQEVPRNFELKRNEIISLINTLAKYSKTLKNIDIMFERRSGKYISKYLGVIGALIFL